MSTVGVCVCGPLLAKEPGLLCAGPKLLPVFIRKLRLQKLNDKKAEATRDGGARLKPYHHGGPHIELKPNSGKVKVEQQEIYDKTA